MTQDSEARRLLREASAELFERNRFLFLIKEIDAFLAREGPDNAAPQGQANIHTPPAAAAPLSTDKVEPLDEFVASLPLDWNHHPADATEGWEMLCRALARYRQLERENAQLRHNLERAVAEKCAEICEDAKRVLLRMPYNDWWNGPDTAAGCADDIRAYAATLPQQPAVAEDEPDEPELTEMM